MPAKMPDNQYSMVDVFNAMLLFSISLTTFNEILLSSMGSLLSANLPDN
jgi:hypothetical protein